MSVYCYLIHYGILFFTVEVYEADGDVTILSTVVLVFCLLMLSVMCWEL